MTLTLATPASPLPGVPLKVRVAALNVSQIGNAPPFARLALTVSVSPTSTSANVLTGTVKEKATPAFADWSTIGLATVGASFTFVTVRAKMSDALKLPLSVAVTVTFTLPTSPLSGVPLNVPVAASKLSHVGKAPPPSNAALNVSVSPASTSANVAAGTTKLNAASSAVA